MSNLHEQLAGVCVGMKNKNLQYLTSLKLPNIVGGKVPKKSLIVLQKWIKETEEAVSNHLLESDLKHYIHHPNFENPFNTQTGASSLIPKSLQHSSSVMIQIIVWSCISEKCNDSIVRALCDSTEKIRIPQKTGPKSDNSSCFKWLHEMAYCIKLAVFLSCRCFESMDVNGIFSDKKYSTLVEFFCMKENVSQTADLFAIIGKNGLPKLTPNSPQYKVIMLQDKLTMARETYLNYIKSGGHIPHKSQMKKNQYYSGCDILSFMLNFEEIKSAHQALKASDSIKTLYDEPQHISNLLYQPPLIGDEDKIKNTLTTVVGLVQIKVKAILTVQALLDQGWAKMKDLFGENGEYDLSIIQRFVIMSLCGSSLVVAINEGTRNHGFYVLKKSFTDALIQATTEPTDGVMDPKQLTLTVFNELSKTLLSDDHFVKSYLQEIQAKKKLPDGENEIWKIHFMDMHKLSQLIKLLPIKPNTELNSTEITEEMSKWARRTHTEAVGPSDIAKYVILNLCAINIAEQKLSAPIGGMCKAQQIICHYINDALQKSSFQASNNADQKMPQKIYFITSVMGYLWNTMFKDVDFHVSFAQMLQKDRQKVYTDDDFWGIHFRNFKWENIYEKKNCLTTSKVMIQNADIPKDAADARVQEKKRKHSMIKSTADNSKKHQKLNEQAQTPHHEKSETFNRFFGRKATPTSTEQVTTSTNRQKATKPESSPMKSTNSQHKKERTGVRSSSRIKKSS